MEYLIEKIKTADLDEIQKLLQTVLERYRQFFPDWEISVLTVNAGEDRNVQLDAVVAMLEKMKK